MIRPASFLVAALALSSPVFGQQESTRQLSQFPFTGQAAPGASEDRSSPPAQELVKLTARSDLVLVPVIVTDKSGKHVSGLEKEAFRLEEDGKVRGISIFEEIKTENPAGRAKASTSEGHSNFLLGDDQPWRITIVCLDMINSPWVRQREAKRQLVAVHGGYPQELELREENECHRDNPWNRLPMQMSHGQLATTSIRVMPSSSKPIKNWGQYNDA